MDNSPTIGVVTVTHNSGSVIDGFMESLLPQSHRELILYVVDNASSDDTLRRLAKYPDQRIVVIPNSINVGVAEGNNLGIRAALSDHCTAVLLINNDTVFDRELIAQLNQGRERSQCDMIVPKIVYFDPPHKVWCAGGAFSLWRGRPRHFGMDQNDDGRFNRPREVAYSPTCCMLIGRHVFARIGVMDPKYFIYFDDADFCWRAQQAGLRLFYLPSTRVYHKVSSMIGHRSDLALRYVTRNHAYYVLKHFSWFEILYYLPVCQAHILVRSWFHKNRARGFVIAQKAFWEGILLFRSNRFRKVISTTGSPLWLEGTAPGAPNASPHAQSRRTAV